MNALPAGAITSPATVTQTTSKTTGVTLNGKKGQIVTHNASLASGARANFAVTNPAVKATDTILANVQSGGTSTYTVDVVAVAANQFTLSLLNTGSTEGAAVTITFKVET